jgi:hypothetical protein
VCNNGFVAKWKDNLSVVNKASFNVGNSAYNTLTKETLEVVGYQTIQKPSNFSKQIPQQYVSITLPWTFAKHRSLHFPAYLTQQDLTFVLEYNLNIESLLDTKALDETKKEVTEAVESIGEVSLSNIDNLKLDQPSIFVTCAYLTSSEIRYYRQTFEGVIYHEDYVSFSSKEHRVHLTSSDPAYKFYWKAQNITKSTLYTSIENLLVDHPGYRTLVDKDVHVWDTSIVDVYCARPPGVMLDSNSFLSVDAHKGSSLIGAMIVYRSMKL